MQPRPALNGRSNASRNHSHGPEGIGFLNNAVHYDSSPMMFCTRTSAMHGRLQSSVDQGTRSLGSTQSATMYRDNFVPKNHTSSPLPRSMEKMNFGSQCASKGNPSVPVIPHHNIPKNLQDKERHFENNMESRVLNESKFEENSSGSTLRRFSKLYTCEVCEKQFVRPSSLTTHRFSHTGEKPHSCSTCGKAFSVASNLRRHEITLHGPRVSSPGTSVYHGLNQTTSDELQRAFLVGSTDSSLICKRGPDIYENLLPSHERFYEVERNPQRR